MSAAPMATLPPRVAPVQRDDAGFRRILLGVVAWHVALLLVSAFVVYNVAAGVWALESLPRTVLGVIGGLGMAGNALAVLLLLRRSHRGRSLSFWVSYLTVVIAGAGFLSQIGVFEGFDVVAASLQASFLWVIVGFLAFVWVVIGRRVRARTSGGIETAALWLERLGYVALAVAGALWLWNMDLVGLVRYSLEAAATSWPATIATGLVAGCAVLAARAMWSTRAERYFGATGAQQDGLVGWLYLSPNLIGFIAFFAGPLVFSLIISFYDWDGVTAATFVGIENYITTLTEPLFWKSMANILIFLVVAVPLSVIPALLLATMINTGYRGTKAYRAVFFIPSVAGVIGVTLIWKQMFNSTVGFINWAIAQMDTFINIFLPGDPLPETLEVGWLSNPAVALYAVIIVFAWSQFGFNTVLFTAGLQGISRELYEAAELDGANAWQRFRHITIPGLRQTTFFVVATTVILCLQVFDIVYALNQPNPVGFPDNATLTPVVYLYQLGFQQDAFGLASAVAWVLFIFIFVLTLAQFRRQRAEAEGVS